MPRPLHRIVLGSYFGEVSILVIEEGGGKTKVAHSTSPSNSREN